MRSIERGLNHEKWETPYKETKGTDPGGKT